MAETPAPTETWKPKIITEEAKAEKLVKIVVYSPPGFGKSTFAATAGLVPEMRNILHVNTGDEIEALKGAENLRLLGTDIVGVPKPDHVDFTTLSDLERLRWYLATEEHGYKTVIIDTISRIAQMVLDQTVARSIKQNPTMSNGAMRGLDDTNRDDYGKVSKGMKRVIGNFRDLPMHVIILAHARIFTYDNAPNQTKPDMSEGIADSLCGMFSTVGYLSPTALIKKGEKGEVIKDKDGNPEKEYHRKLVFESRNGVYAKDRSPGNKLGKEILDPTMQTIYTLLNS